MKRQEPTIFKFLFPTLPDFLGRIPLTDDGILLTVLAPVRGEKWSAWMKMQSSKGQVNLDIRWFCLVAFLLATPASNTAGLGATLGDFNLASSGHGQRMLARTTPFPWNVDGSTRLVMLLVLVVVVSVIGDVVLQIILLVEFLNLGNHVHIGMVVVVVVMAAGVVLGGEQTKGKRFSRWWWYCCC